MKPVDNLFDLVAAKASGLKPDIASDPKVVARIGEDFEKATQQLARMDAESREVTATRIVASLNSILTGKRCVVFSTHPKLSDATPDLFTQNAIEEPNLL